MNEPVWARKREIHSTPELYGIRCNNCPKLSCSERRGAKLHPWRYYCNSLHKELKLKDMYALTVDDCPEHRKLPQRRFR